MMFNGFLVYGDSDTSDVTKSSNEPLSLAESSASDSTRALSLESQLQATRQILKNKEETVRVQAESLALAEARIAELSEKVHGPSKRNTSSQPTTPITRDCSSGCCVETVDVSTSDLHMDHDAVSSLRDHLSVVEELYRECFYEAAKQQDMMDKLRKSHQDMRLMDKQKAEEIDRLQRALHTQKWSLERYQDIAGEVEHLKSEIMNFISSSNDDSGVWGAGAAGARGAGEEEEDELAGGLRHVADQLLRLRDTLADECTSGLEEDNKKLRQTNDSLNQEVCRLRERVRDLEKTLENKENLDKEYEKQIKEKEEQLRLTKQQLAELKGGSSVQGAACETVKGQLQQLQGILNAKIDQLKKAEECCQRHDETTKQLREQLKKMNDEAKENKAVREEVQHLATQMAQWRQQLARSGRRVRALEDELRTARHACAHLAGHCSEKGAIAASLQELLSQAQQRCEALCGDARRVVCDARDALQRLRHRQREQDVIIKQQESLIRSLREQTRSNTERASEEPGCSYVGARWTDLGCGASCDRTRCSRYTSARNIRSSESDARSPTPPIPPRRILRKKTLSEDQNCSCGAGADSDSCMMRRRYTDMALHSSCSYRRRHQPTRDAQLSPTAEILERVERAHEALESAQRRWGRRFTRGDVRDKRV